MAIYVIEFRDYNSAPVFRTFTNEKGRDVSKDLKAISAEAEKEGYKGMASAIPDKYFIAMGYNPVKDAEYYSTEERPLGHHVVPAKCENCEHFEDGYCWHYGTVSNEDYTQCHRYNNCTARKVMYDGEDIGIYFTVCGDDEPTVETVIAELAEAGIDVYECAREYVYDNLKEDRDFIPSLIGISRE